MEDGENTWLFSEDDFLFKSPSRDSFTVEQELRVREGIYEFIIKLGATLKLDAKSIYGAMVFVNRFYMRTPITSSKYYVACGAISISCKLHDTYRLPNKIALAGCQIKHPDKLINENNELFWLWRDQLLYREELLLSKLNFELNIEFPYDVRNYLINIHHDNNPRFEDKKIDIMKNTVSIIELLSSLPVLVAYDLNTTFATVLIMVMIEANQRFNLDMKLPKDYIANHLHIDINLCLNCYHYIILLLEYCHHDVKAISNKPATKRLKKLPVDEILKVVDESIPIKPIKERSIRKLPVGPKKMEHRDNHRNDRYTPGHQSKPRPNNHHNNPNNRRDHYQPSSNNRYDRYNGSSTDSYVPNQQQKFMHY